jgi:Na+:H+ antiporter, NhaA family
MVKKILSFIQHESFSGFILFFVTMIALLLANSHLAATYYEWINFSMHLKIQTRQIDIPLSLIVNDGLMVIFFFVIGLEIKREIVEGELNSIKKATLPALGAIGGMLFPAVIYMVINQHDLIALKGWAIPSATDIAFSLAILTVLQSRLPVSLKVFLTALAIIDDLGAILIIAFFYTAQLSYIPLCLAGVCLCLLILLNRFNIVGFLPYGIVGLFLWVFVLQSGVHPTIAGVLTALAYPSNVSEKALRFRTYDLESVLLPWVSFLILPLFAFVNAGVSFGTMTFSTILNSIPLGIILGLFLGKQLGIMSFCYLGIKMKISKLPEYANWLSLYAVCIICGVGFTMSLFIGNLAFADFSSQAMNLVKVGVLFGSLLSAVIGMLVIILFSPRKALKPFNRS